MADASVMPAPETQADDAAPAIDAEADAARKAKRKKYLTLIAAVVIALGLIYAAWYVLVGSHYVSTDNAYVGAEVAQITPMVGGQVASVAVRETQMVRAGEVLLRIDDADARIALAQAEADLARARNQYGQVSATGGALAAQVAAREAEITRARAGVTSAEAQLREARIDLQRRRDLAPNGAVSGEELTAATSAYQTAQANLQSARATLTQAMAARKAATGELAANRAVAGSAGASGNPDVLAAQARLDAARLDLERTVIRAPVGGIVANKTVQVGQRVAAGTRVMEVIPLDRVYVDANFKESQLDDVRIGQPVTLTSDLYGDAVEYHGRVVGFAGATGAASALIPAQNATGNWIKVVQRLPIRIALDPKQLASHPLRVGLSMEATVNVSDR